MLVDDDPDRQAVADQFLLVARQHLDGLTQALRRRSAAQEPSQQPVTSRAPRIPSPYFGSDVETTDRWRRESQELLAAGQQHPPGQPFTVAGRTFSRVDRPHALAGNIRARDPDTGELLPLNRAEKHAFWAWAVIEVLRHTGIRVENCLNSPITASLNTACPAPANWGRAATAVRVVEDRRRIELVPLAAWHGPDRDFVHEAHRTGSKR